MEDQREREPSVGGDGIVLPRNERLQMQQIRELEMEQLEVEEVDSARESSSSDDSRYAITVLFCPLPSPLLSFFIRGLYMTIFRVNQFSCLEFTTT